MSDMAIVIKDNCFDLNIVDGDLQTDSGLETAVIISLFTDRRIQKRGWWGDMFAEIDQDKIGSRLWTLERSKRTNETLRLAEDYSEEALEWLIEDGVSTQIEVVASYDENNFMNLEVDIFKPLGRTTRFSMLWDFQEGARDFTRIEEGE
ncbi:UNVERIFIED_CONTAM: hypothetical protein GTU68_057162 [Idotea baltica]|nr:hypothetical protein [Idotea baltica]